MPNDGVSNEELLDMLQLTQAFYPHKPNVEVLLKYSVHEGLDRLFSDEAREVIPAGKSIDCRVQVKTSGAAKQTRPYAVDAPSVSPVVKPLTVNWTYHQTDYTIERNEMLQNMGSKVQLGSLVKSRRLDALLDSADLLEELIWDVPLTTSDDLNPYGVPYHLVPITSAQVAAPTSGFQGQNPLAQDAGDFGSHCGLDASASDNALWKSYNDVWTSTDGSVTEDDLDKMRTAFRKCRFRSPQNVKELDEVPGRNLRFYAGNTWITQAERAARAQNDQVGADIGKFAEQTAFKRIPLIYVPILDGRDSSNTVYGQYPLVAINWNFLKIAVLKGNIFRENKPINTREQHNVFTTFFDLTWQMYTNNRQRLGFILSYVA